VFGQLNPGTALGAAEYCRLQATATRALLLEGLELSVSEHWRRPPEFNPPPSAASRADVATSARDDMRPESGVRFVDKLELTIPACVENG
jgi:hypothetical protein